MVTSGTKLVNRVQNGGEKPNFLGILEESVDFGQFHEDFQLLQANMAGVMVKCFVEYKNRGQNLSFHMSFVHLHQGIRFLEKFELR